MVFFYTSANIKILQNIWMDYEEAEEVSPYEYIKSYVEKCPKSVDNEKLTWVAETFLGHHKHFPFLREISAHLSEGLSEDDQDYFIIIFHATTFQLDPKDMPLLYKSVFNLSKPLLNKFTAFLSNNEMLTYIAQVAQGYYDNVYVTDKIIAPLFAWQPYISEMAHNYAEYMNKVEMRKMKHLTIPILPNITLSHKGKEPAKAPSQPSLSTSLPAFVHNKHRKMLTKSVIDRRLKDIFEANKQDAEKLLKTVNDKDFHYARYSKRPQHHEPEVIGYQKPKRIVYKSTIPVRENNAVIKRINHTIRMTEQEELQWLQKVMMSCRSSSRFDAILDEQRKDKQNKNLLDIEKKHLLGQISHEEAIIAKKKVEDDNKKKYQDFLKEKEQWDEAISKWKKAELQRIKTFTDNVSMTELHVLEAKNAVLEKNKETAEKVRKENEEKIAEAIRVRNEILDKKIKMIKQIKILSMIAKKSRIAKIVDLTESSGIGLFCEMSIAELQERLVLMKTSIKEELQKRKERVKAGNEAAKKEFEEAKNYAKAFFKEREEIRKQANSKSKSVPTLDGSNNKEINDLKKTLEAKRKLRFKLES